MFPLRVLASLLVLVLLAGPPRGDAGRPLEDDPGALTASPDGPGSLPAPEPSTAFPGDRRGVRVLPVGSDLADLEVDPARPRAYVADRWGGRVLVVSTGDGSLEAEIPTRQDPVALAIDPSARTLYVGHAGNASIAAVDLETLRVRGYLATAFLVWDLAAPTDGTLVATTHDPGWSGEYPYVLNATDGRVLERPCDAACSLVYQDAILALSPDRTRLFFADTAVIPLSVWSFSFDPVAGRWTYDRTSPNYGELGAVAKDLAVSPDNGFVYLATIANSLMQVDARNLTYAGTFGSFTQSASVVVSRSGHRIAMSPYEPVVYLYTPAGVQIDAHALSGRVERLRATGDGSAFLATVGEDVQDVELVPTTRIQAVWPPTTVLPERRPPLVAQIVTFASGDVLGGETAVDGRLVPSGLDGATGFLTGVPGTDLDDGDHLARATALIRGREVASTNWSFSIDLTPPLLVVDPIPARVETGSLLVTGRATDAHDIVVRVNGAVVPVAADGMFSQRLDLRPGVTQVTVVAEDAAGNEAAFRDAVEFLGLGSWYLHPAKHFRIRAPWGWYVRGNASTAGGSVDVIIQDAIRNVDLSVRSEARDIPESGGAATALLEEDLATLASQPGFRYLEPIHPRTLGGHPAASAFYAASPGSLPVYEVRLLVVGAEWGMTWTLKASMLTWDARPVLALANASIETFEVLRPPAPAILPSEGLSPLLVWGGILAATVELAILLSLVRRERRRRP